MEENKRIVSVYYTDTDIDKYIKIYLGGSICENNNWRQKIIDTINTNIYIPNNAHYIIYSSNNANLDDIDNSIKWEYNAIKDSDLIIFGLYNNDKCKYTLFNLGLLINDFCNNNSSIMNKKMIVYAESDSSYNWCINAIKYYNSNHNKTDDDHNLKLVSDIINLNNYIQFVLYDIAKNKKI